MKNEKLNESQLETKRTFIDMLQSQLNSMNQESFFKKKDAMDDWRKQMLIDQISRATEEFKELEREIIARKIKGA